MSKDNAQSIALTDVVGPFNELNERLVGRKGGFWLKALNRFLRMEKAFPFRKIAVRLPSTDGFEFWHSLKEVQGLGIKLGGGVEEAKIPDESPPNEPVNLIEVPILEIFKTSELKTLQYEHILEKGAEMGFDPCPPLTGLWAISRLIKKDDVRHGPQEMSVEFLVCSNPIQSSDGEPRLFYAAIHRNRNPEDKGSLWLYTAKPSGTPGHDITAYRQNPALRLIFAF